MTLSTLIKLALVGATIWAFSAGLNRIDLEKIGSVQTERIEQIDSIR